jgi:hypothetical protein
MELWEAVGVTILLGPLVTTVVNLLYAMARAEIQDIASRGEVETHARPGNAALLGLLLAYAASSAIMTAGLEHAVRVDGVYALGYLACALVNLVSLWVFATLLGGGG